MDKDRENSIFTYKTPYISFPRFPNKITIDGHMVNDYLHPDIMSRLIDNLCKKINLNDFEAVLVNMKGGKYLYDEIVKRKGEPKRMEVIEYHRPEKGFGAIVVIPVSRDLYNKKCLLVDDILDSGGVSNEIGKNLSADSASVFVVKKRGIVNQIEINNKLVAVEIDDVWVGGCGMNLETLGDGLPKDFSRDYPGIIVKIQ